MKSRDAADHGTSSEQVPVEGCASDLNVRLFSLGWQGVLARPLTVDVESPDLKVASPQTIAIKIAKLPGKVRSFYFDEETGSIFQEPAGNAASVGRNRKRNGRSVKRDAARVRIQPPSDLVKLQDRLFYALQPPLQSLLSSNELQFPFDPFPYQYEGVAFLYPRFSAVLADEMGLGKTMQAITSVRLLLCSSEVKSVLFICPKPLVTNWQREFALWAPEIPVAVIEGDQQTRAWQWRDPRAPVKIANYELLVRDQETVGSTCEFDLVILDEAQRIKNRNSATSRVVRSIQRTRSWALTGTPIENSADDLVGIFEFLSPGYLSPGMEARRMGPAVRDYILRRTKDMVLTDLPPKMFRDAELQLTSQQWASYQAAEDTGVIRLTELGDEMSIQHVFELVLRLKQVCNFDPVTGASAKLERLQADLDEVAASGKKAIVFSQWVRSLEQIAEGIGEFRPLQYHGKIAASKRDAILREFRDDPSRHVLLMSYGAGSVGLNLQFCEYVFLFDRWWNPAVEDQAINRAHRIGAAGPVTVTRMLCTDTIEERIDQVLSEKRELFDVILSQTGQPSNLNLTREEIFGLFNLKTPPVKPNQRVA
ncbi:MAG TPA: helicase [Planctomycetaceae bacterium]|nr:helicase [Blastopirellula sp.]HAY81293.1 helicase [Planctomycetaceae bacterium]